MKLNCRVRHTAKANLAYIPVWFQPLQLPSTQSEGPIALVPLDPNVIRQPGLRLH
jgi:hypothetical protein